MSISDLALDSLAFQTQELQSLYAAIEEQVTNYGWMKVDQAPATQLKEVEDKIAALFHELDNQDQLLRRLVNGILDDAMTDELATDIATAAGFIEEINSGADLPPMSPRALAKAGQRPAK